jgi:hypothetical protein
MEPAVDTRVLDTVGLLGRPLMDGAGEFILPIGDVGILMDDGAGELMRGDVVLAASPRARGLEAIVLPLCEDACDDVENTLGLLGSGIACG